MSDQGLTEDQMTAEFDRLSEDKGDRLAEMFGTEAPDTDDPETDEGSTSTETAPAAPAAGDTTATTSAQPATAAAAKPAAAATDIWANAPADLRDAHQRALAAADQRYRSDIGRQAAHQRRIQLLEEENRTLRNPKPAQAAVDGSTAKTTPASLLDSPEIKAARENYPEAVEPFVKPIEALETQLRDIARDMTITREERNVRAQEAQEAALVAAHPDWRQACASKEFADWLNGRSQSVKDIVARNGENIVNAEEAIDMVDSFKAHLALTKPAPQTQQTQPARPATQPTNLQQRRAAQLRAVTNAPKDGATAVPDGPADTGDQAVFNHFAAKKVGNRK